MILVYGPPAAGKLTVSTELAKLTGYKLFHNHVSIDCVRPVFEFGTPPFFRMVERIRMDMLAEAAREGVDVIHTFVYAHGPDDDYVARVIAAVEENGGTAELVMLTCRVDETLARVSNEERLSMRKIATPSTLAELHEKYDLYTPYPGRESLVIDNTDLPPDECASLIIRHYDLSADEDHERT